MGTIQALDMSTFDGPKYRAVAQNIRNTIAEGRLHPGEKLPTVRDLAWDLKITPGTVARAYSLLTDEGLLTAGVGRGTFVADTIRSSKDEKNWMILSPPAESRIVALFSPRLPDVGQVDAIRTAMKVVSERKDTDFLNYPSREGFEPARRAVVHWLRGAQLGALAHRDIVLTHGGQNGISLVMQAVLRGRRPVVLVEELSYPGFRRVAELLRAEVVPVPMDEHGIIPEELDRLARAHAAQILCTSPEVHNPTGLFTPIERRKAIAKIAVKRGFDILEDDCYRLNTARLPSYRLLLPQQSWYVSSISKILSPSLRVGFAIAPVERSNELRRVAEFGFFGLARPLADMTEVLLSDPRIEDLAAKVRAEVGEFIRAAVNALGKYDLSWHQDVPFFWLRLPEGWRATAFCQAAEAEGMQIRAAEDFSMRDAQAPHAVRIAVNAQVTLASFEDAMQRLRRLLDNPPESFDV